MSDPLRDAENDSEQEEDLALRMHERQHRPASIDMALNLERELDDEHEHEHGQQSEHNKFHSSQSASIEASSRAAGTSRLSQEHPSHSPGSDNNGNVSAAEDNKRVSFDPEVLQHIITNLRTELAKAQSERDALAETLAGAPTREAELREALNLVTERCASVESELEKMKRKSQEDEESIQMLRTKLEESRRALMRLQTESKRMSHMSVDIGRANSLFGGAPSSSKRASFTPLTGSGAGFSTGAGASSRATYGHRRISSISEPGDALDTGAEPTSPTGQSRSWTAESDANVKKARRSSAFFGGMPMSMGLARSATPSPPQLIRQLATENGDASVAVHELETIRKERDAVRTELATARQELAEAQEAREASEQCVAALRAFISEQTSDDTAFGKGNNSANGILKLPPLPSEKNVDESAATPNKKAGRPALGGSGWSFGKLFRAESGGSSTGSPSAAVVSPPAAADGKPPSLNGSAIDTSTPTKATSSIESHSPSPSTATPGGTFSRTFGGFFSGRAPSVSSVGSVTSPSSNPNFGVSSKHVRPPTAHGQQEPTLNGLGSDDEDDADGNPPSLNNSLESRSSVTGPTTEPASPDVSRASEDTEVIWIRNTESAGSRSSVGERGIPSHLKDKERESAGKGEEGMVPVSL